MKNYLTTNRTFRKFIVAATILFGLSLSTTAFSQSRSTTLEILRKTSFVIDDACEISSYFYYNNSSLSQAIYYQEYAYKLYDVRRYESAIYYSLRARDYALDAIEDCDDYWEYYDYYNYGYSPVWGTRSSSVTINISFGNFHFGNMNCNKFTSVYKRRQHCRLNYDYYFTSAEMRYMQRCPARNIMLDDFHRHMGNIRFDNYRPSDIAFRSRIVQDRNEYTRLYAKNAQHIQTMRPNDIRPHSAARPTSYETRRMTTSGTVAKQEPRRRQESVRQNTGTQHSTNGSTSGSRRETSQGTVGTNNTQRPQHSTTGTTGSRRETTTNTTTQRPNTTTTTGTTSGSRRETTTGTTTQRPQSTTTTGTTGGSRREVSTSTTNQRPQATTSTQSTARRTSTTSRTTDTKTAQQDQKRREKDQQALQKAGTSRSTTTSTSTNSGSSTSSRRR